MDAIRILHISDLHITPPHTSLDEVFRGTHWLEPGSFDLVVVSGDLVHGNRGISRAEEYDELFVFASRRLVPLVKDACRSRIVFVPGNHDVDWSASCFTSRPWASLASQEEIRSFLEAARGQPSAFKRSSLSRFGHLELFEVAGDTPAEKWEKYAKRLDGVSGFIEKFYSDDAPVESPYARAFGVPLDLTKTSLAEVKVPTVLKSFELSSPGSDWSATYLPDSGILVIGMSSIHLNDRYWYGAEFSSVALNEIATFITHVRRESARLIVLGVWHHGFQTSRGGHDRLEVADLNALADIGIQVGFHGHVHQDSFIVQELFASRICVVGTGSIGAGPHELPRGLENQFAIAEILADRLRVEWYRRFDGVFGADPYRKPEEFTVPDGSRIRDARRRQSSPATATLASHVRTWTVDMGGVAEVDIQMDVSREGNLPLAVVSPPFCRVVHRSRATTVVGQVEVQRQKFPDGRVRYGVTSAEVGKLGWKYWVSNAIALNSWELKVLPPRDDWHPNARVGWDVRSHVVRVPTDHLRLRLEFAEPVIQELAFLAERRCGDGKPGHWEVDASETARILADLASGERAGQHMPIASAVLEVKAPKVEHRYSIMYKPLAKSGLRPDVLSLLRELIKQCRGAEAGSGIHVSLTAALRETIVQYLSPTQRSGEDDADASPGSRSVGPWTGFLFQSERRSLRTCFGDFPVRSWTSEFKAGDGVAGHCFRFGSPASWRDDEDGASERIQSLCKEPREGQAYKWILNFPIWFDRLAIGVIGFAGGDENVSGPRGRIQHLAQGLYDELRDMYGLDRRTCPAQDTKNPPSGVADELATVISTCFWEWVRTSPEFGARFGELASEGLEHLVKRTEEGRPNPVVEPSADETD